MAAAPNPTGHTRVGLSVSGVRPAVLRNRLRRRLRAALRAPLLQNPGLDVIVMAGADAALAPYRTLASDVATAVGAAAALVTQRLQSPGAS